MKPSRGTGGATGDAAGEARGTETREAGGGRGAKFTEQPPPLPTGEAERCRSAPPGEGRALSGEGSAEPLRFARHEHAPHPDGSAVSASPLGRGRGAHFDGSPSSSCLPGLEVNPGIDPSVGEVG